MPDPIRKFEDGVDAIAISRPFDWTAYLEEMTLGVPEEIESESARVYFRAVARRMGFTVTTGKTDDGRLWGMVISKPSGVTNAQGAGDGR